MKDTIHKVAVGVLIFIAVTFVGWLGQDVLLPAVGHTWRLVLGCLAWLGQDSGAPNWLVGLLGLGTLALLVSIALVVVASLERSPPEPTFRDFVTLDAFGVRWKWEWSSAGSVQSLRPFCACDRLALFKEPDYPGLPYDDAILRIVCRPCGKSIDTSFQSIAGIKQAVIIEIDRIVRSGEWRALVETDAAASA